MASEVARRIWARAWRESAPIEHNPHGVPREILRRIREADPRCVLRWHPHIWQIQDEKGRPVQGSVGVWRINDDGYPIFQFYSPFGPHLDGRLVVSIRRGDKARRDLRQRERDMELERDLDERERAADKKAMATIDEADHDKLAWARDKKLAEETGSPRGIFCAVPDKIEAGGSEAAA